MIFLSVTIITKYMIRNCNKHWIVDMSFLQHWPIHLWFEEKTLNAKSQLTRSYLGTTPPVISWDLSLTQSHLLRSSPRIKVIAIRSTTPRFKQARIVDIQRVSYSAAVKAILQQRRSRSAGLSGDSIDDLNSRIGFLGGVWSRFG